MDGIECSALPHRPKLTLRIRLRIRIESENEQGNQSQQPAVAIRPSQASLASCLGEAFELVIRKEHCILEEMRKSSHS